MNREQAMKLAQAVLDATSRHLCGGDTVPDLNAIVAAHVAQAECSNSDSWNCKYCRNTESCEALKDPRNFSASVKPQSVLPIVTAPDGWQLVPVEATDDMLWALYGFLVGQITEPDRQRYRAMLAAATKPEGDE